MLLTRQELQGKDLLELTPVELDWRCLIEAVQSPAVLEARLQQMTFEGLLVAMLDLVGEQQGKERDVLELPGACRRQPLRQGR
jgi:hypothetical protein